MLGMHTSTINTIVRIRRDQLRRRVFGAVIVLSLCRVFIRNSFSNCDGFCGLILLAIVAPTFRVQLNVCVVVQNLDSGHLAKLNKSSTVDEVLES